jgi:hypothetical protein
LSTGGGLLFGGHCPPYTDHSPLGGHGSEGFPMFGLSSGFITCHAHDLSSMPSMPSMPSMGGRRTGPGRRLMRGVIDAFLRLAPGGPIGSNPAPRPMVPTFPHHNFVGPMGSMGSMGSTGPGRPRGSRAPAGGPSLPVLMRPEVRRAGPAPIHRPSVGDSVNWGSRAISHVGTIGATWTL